MSDMSFSLMNNNSRIYNTFGLQATADRYVEVSREDELRALLTDPSFVQSPHLVLGGGSNMVFVHHFPGTIVHPVNKGISPLSEDCGGGGVLVEAAAGEEWDHFVHFCIDNGWHGAENLAAIPGTVGAAPVQNVGAYGLEAKDLVHSVRTFEVGTGRERIFSNSECRFAYRDSIFKHELKDRYVVWSVTFRMQRTFQPDIHYKALSDALSARDVDNPTPRQLADVVADVRWSKLPRPEVMGSAGSFFKNPVVPPQHYQQLKEQYPGLVAYPVSDGYKLAAGWLIEHAGWKGRTMGRCGVYDKQALVLVNHGHCTGEEVLALAQKITEDVRAQFGVNLTMEAIIV